MRRRMALVAAVLAAVTFLSACGGDDTEDQTAGDTTETTAGEDPGEEGGGEAATFAVTASETGDGKYAFDAPDTVAAGVVDIQLTNSGQEPHQAALIKLDDGKTFDDFVASLSAGEGAAPPEWRHSAGGVSIANPGGGEASLTQELEAGTYVLACEIPGPDGKPHAANGMAKELTVEEGEGGGELPEADVTIAAKDFSFDVAELPAGEATIEFVNQGPSIHEVVMFAMADGKKAADVIQFFSGPPAGPPPFTAAVGGLAPIETGGEAVTTTTLQAGSYALLCFVPAPTGEPHFALGMTMDITVT